MDETLFSSFLVEAPTPVPLRWGWASLFLWFLGEFELIRDGDARVSAAVSSRCECGWWVILFCNLLSRESGGFSIIFCRISSALSFTNTLLGQFFPLLLRQVSVGIVDLRVILILVQSISAVMKKLLNPAGRSAVPQFLLEAQNSDYTPSTSIREEIEGKTMIRENVQLQ